MYYLLNNKIINALKKVHLLHFIFITTFCYLVIENKLDKQIDKIIVFV